MKKLLLIGALALSLGACATTQAIVGATITQGQVDAAWTSYDGTFLAGLRRYALLPKCAPAQTFLKNQCHDAAMLKQLRLYDREVGNDFNLVQANLDAGNNNALVNSWTVLNSAIDLANTTLTQARSF